MSDIAPVHLIMSDIMDRSAKRTIRLKPQLNEALDDEAKTLGISTSALIRSVLVKHVQKSKSPGRPKNEEIRGGSSEPIEPVKVSDALS